MLGSLTLANVSRPVKSDQLTLLLPPWAVLERQGDAALLAAMRVRGDVVGGAVPGLRAQQLRVFDVVPKPAAWAAITREFDCADTAGYQWLRADPAYVQVEAGGLRLMALGDDLALEPSEAEELSAAVRPCFHDLGMVFDAPNPARWYVQIARGRPTPRFVDPEDALGSSGTPLPASETAGREWPRLLNETQMVLHLHPVNRERARRGQQPVNSLWLWGAGELPIKVASEARALITTNAEFAALARLGRVRVFAALAEATGCRPEGVVMDARHAPRENLLNEAIERLASGAFGSLRLDCEDGTLVVYKRWHRFRFWR